MEQFKRAPSRIYLLSLILSSKPHQKASYKVLNEAHVPQDINQETMEYIGQNPSLKLFVFNEDEIDPDDI